MRHLYPGRTYTEGGGKGDEGEAQGRERSRQDPTTHPTPPLHPLPPPSSTPRPHNPCCYGSLSRSLLLLLLLHPSSLRFYSQSPTPMPMLPGPGAPPPPIHGSRRTGTQGAVVTAAAPQSHTRHTTRGKLGCSIWISSMYVYGYSHARSLRSLPAPHQTHA